ncbi:hypothetical protein [Sphingobium sp. LMC3-1-1.1]|uniref:hypothetical protein n=1 Tax=unclassified Sphingobium TaxID=2611147 RepID=UPI0034438173
MSDAQEVRRRFSAFRSAAEEVGMANEQKAKADASLKYAIQQKAVSQSDSQNYNQRNYFAMNIENTDLERRVLAHERILRALIRHIAEEQPDILARLKQTFGQGHVLGEEEQDYVTTQQYGDQFIRAIEQAIVRKGDTV